MQRVVQGAPCLTILSCPRMKTRPSTALSGDKPRRAWSAPASPRPPTCPRHAARPLRRSPPLGPVRSAGPWCCMGARGPASGLSWTPPSRATWCCGIRAQTSPGSWRHAPIHGISAQAEIAAALRRWYIISRNISERVSPCGEVTAASFLSTRWCDGLVDAGAITAGGASWRSPGVSRWCSSCCRVAASRRCSSRQRWACGKAPFLRISRPRTPSGCGASRRELPRGKEVRMKPNRALPLPERTALPPGALETIAQLGGTKRQRAMTERVLEWQVAALVAGRRIEAYFEVNPEEVLYIFSPYGVLMSSPFRDLIESFPLAYSTVRRRHIPKANLAEVLQGWDASGRDLTRRPLVALVVREWQRACHRAQLRT